MRYVVTAVLALWAGAAVAADIKLEGTPPSFTVHGAKGLAAAGEQALPDILQVTVAGTAAQPILGTYRREAGVLQFRPQFPLEPGVTYQARYKLGTDATDANFTLPKAALGAATVIERVYPSASRLPENTLKFYIHFSQPMSRGGVYQWIQLRDEKDGQEVKQVFLELQEELWDPDLRRLTLLLDPGRIKREILPNREMGPPLQAGHKYTLVIDPRWPDATGQPLKAGFSKSFDVGASDRTVLDLATWKVTPPKAGTVAPLTIAFPKSLDSALMTRVIQVNDSRGGMIDGSVEITAQETRWVFTPEQPWAAGRYILVVPNTLEDVSGNKINRLFDVDTSDVTQTRPVAATYTLPFEVAAR